MENYYTPPEANYIPPPPAESRRAYIAKQIKDGLLDQSGLEKLMASGQLSQQDYQAVMAFVFSQSPEKMATANHSGLYAARSAATKEQQNLMAPYEHRAFAREAVTENPWMALPIAAGIPAYQAYKSVFGSRSDNSMGQVWQGFKGIGEGLRRSL